LLKAIGLSCLKYHNFVSIVDIKGNLVQLRIGQLFHKILCDSFK